MVSHRSIARDGHDAQSHLCLGDEEPDEDEHAQTETGESDESSIAALAHGNQHVRHCTSDDKVEQPLSGSGERYIQPSETSSRNFGNVDPADLHEMSAMNGTSKFCNLRHLPGPNPIGRTRQRGKCKRVQHIQRESQAHPSEEAQCERTDRHTSSRDPWR